MSRIKENGEFLESVKRDLSDMLSNQYFDVSLDLQGEMIRNLLLVDISKSLAIIADKINGDE